MNATAILSAITGSEVALLKEQDGEQFWYSFEKGKDPNIERCCWLMITKEDGTYELYDPMRKIGRKEFVAPYIPQTFHEKADEQYGRLLNYYSYGRYEDRGCILAEVEAFDLRGVTDIDEYVRMHKIEFGIPLDEDYSSRVREAFNLIRPNRVICVDSKNDCIYSLWRSGDGESWKMSTEYNLDGTVYAVGLYSDIKGDKPFVDYFKTNTKGISK